jgi:signal peptidase I
MLFRLVLVLVIATGVLAAALFGLTRQFTIASVGMEPTIKKGDRVAVFRFSDRFYAPHRQDIVIFKAPPVAVRTCGKSGIVDRVIGLPGETVSEQTGRVSIDGKPLREPYVKAGYRDTRTAAWLVPKGQYFLIGDNRKGSCDSRAWGSVPKQNIIGKLFLTFWPFDRVSIN